MESSGPAGPTSIPAILADAVVYPMRGHGVFLIILGGLMVGFLEMVSAYNILFMISLFIGIFASGYFANYMFKIIQHTTMGERNLPTWPDFADILQTILIPFFQMLVAILLSFAPAILPLLVWGITPTGVYGSMAVALYGFFYLPMALLAIALNGSISALKPTVVFPAIRAIIGPYLVIYLALVIIACVSGTLQNVVAENIPILGIMLNAVVSTFFVAMEMRLIGSIYLAHRERIDLF